MTTALYVLNLQVSQFLRLNAINISPAGAGVVELTGDNGEGKSSTLEAIWSAIGGARCVPEQPLHQDEAGELAEKGFVSVLVGEDPEHPLYRVTRNFKRSEEGAKEPWTTSLVVKSVDGLKGGQELLTGWLGSLTIDPMKFLGQQPADQGETLRKLVGLDTAKLDKARAEAFALRRDVNRDLKQVEGELAGIVVPEEIPEAVDVEALLEEQRAGMEAKQARAEQLDELSAARTLQHEAVDNVGEIERRIALLQEELKAAKEFVENGARDLAKAEAEPAIEVPDLEAISKRIAAAAAVNRAHDIATAVVAHHAQVKAKVDAKQAEATALTSRLARMDKEKAAAIAACKMPIEGLAVGDDGAVTFKGKPLSQASSAESIRVALAIAMAQSPRLRVIHIRDGSLLDKKSKAAVFQFATEHKLQVWIETVYTDNEAAIVIEDGKVREVA